MIVLVVAAHPDDEVLGCGGTIARLASEGHEVHVAILGEGISARFETRDVQCLESLRAIRERSRRVGELLGAVDVVCHDLPSYPQWHDLHALFRGI